MTETELGGLFRRADASPTHLGPAIAIDLDAPPGSHRRPLGNPEHAARSYLLGLRCACGTTSLAYSAAVENQEGIQCPGCSTSLT